MVRASEQFQKAEASARLIKIPTGDGMALVFYTSPEAPAQCAIEISGALKEHPHLQLRMGVHSGPVSGVIDVNGRANLAGAGLNMAQRVMNCGDAGHILLSKHVAEDLGEYEQWRPLLHDLGTCEVKHGVRVSMVNLYTDRLGNAALPKKFQILRKKKTRARWAMLMAALLALAAIGTVFVIFSRNRASPTVRLPEKSIAVLPFENLSDDKQNSYFTDGVQDEILADLAKVADLKVISRTSVMLYKSGNPRNLREIGQQLGVAHVLEGSVQRAANRVRVNAQLIDARTDAHLWAQTYDRDLADIFAIQSELAQAIADQLRAKISTVEKAAIEEQPTSDLKAYDLYIEAKELLNGWIGTKNAKESLLKAVRLLDEATQRDPNFVLAYCQLADAHEDLYWFDIDHTAARLALAKQAVDTAVRLRPELGETHLAQADYHFRVFRDYDTARDELVEVRRTLPNNSNAIFFTSLIDRRQHRWEESLRDMRKANELDPRNLEIIRSISDSYLLMRRYSDQEQFLNRELTFIPELAAVFNTKLAECYLAKGDPTGANAFLNKVPADFNPTGFGSFYRLTAALFVRDYKMAKQILTVAPSTIPEAYLGLQCPHAWFEGQIARARQDYQKAEAAFTDARKDVQTAWGDNTNDPARLSLIARIDAGRGHKDDAIREARRALELRPIDKDSLDGPVLATSLAVVYAWSNERDLGIKQLSDLAKIPAGPSYGDLRFNPRWDDLRGDPRFEKIVASLAPKS